MKKLKIMTIVGTRPEMIRLCRVIQKLDACYDHVFVHTGQNFDRALRDQFFDDLGLRKPDYQFNLQEQRIGFPFIGAMFQQMAEIIDTVKPDAALILGDTHSCLASYVCKQKGVKVFHMEAGNRCYDEKVPEEVNRRIVDSCSDWLLTYTQRSREQLLREGYHPSRIIVTGNPITEVLTHFNRPDLHCDLLEKRGIPAKSYILSTLHRSENTSSRETLTSIIAGLNAVAQNHPIILSVHPKLASMLEKFELKLAPSIVPAEPFRFTDFIYLMKNARAIISDSGTVPEEACIMGVPCVLIRDSTERPELLENNSMVVSGVGTEAIVNSLAVAVSTPVGARPRDYGDLDVSDKIAKIIAAVYWSRTEKL